MFFRGSRYESVPTTEFTTGNGRVVQYKRMRFIPAFETALRQRVREDDRPDLLAYRVLGDPEQFWRLTDANRVLRPVELTAVPGQSVSVPGPGSEGA